MNNLRVCWLSAGVSSFMGGYLAQPIDKWIYIDIDDQQQDSMRFIHDKGIPGKKLQLLCL